MKNIYRKKRLRSAFILVSFLFIVFALLITILNSGEKHTTDTNASTLPSGGITKGAYDFWPSNKIFVKNCYYGDTGCFYETDLTVTNRTGKPLHSHVMFSGSAGVTFMDFNGEWTSKQTELKKIIDNGNTVVNTRVKFVPPQAIGTWYGSFYMDGRTCNTNTTPYDCYAYGASSLNVVINVIPYSTPVPRVMKKVSPTPKNFN